MLEDPIRFGQDVADVVTRADVTWLEQGTDDDGTPTTTERHALQVDADLEEALGQRGYSLTTQLTQAADADRVALVTLSRLHSREWRTSGLTWSVRYEKNLTQLELENLLGLLDGANRLGQPITSGE